MGKKSRVKEFRKLENEKLQAQLAKERKGKIGRTVTVIVSVVAILLALTIILSSCSLINNSGIFMRNKVSMSTENFEVDNTMLSFYFYYEYLNLARNNPSFTSKINPALSLKGQNYSSTLSYYDYIMGRAISNVNSYLTRAEAALDKGLELDDKDREGIDEVIESIKLAAKDEKMSTGKYISTLYGTGVKESDIRRALEIVILADKLDNHLIEELSFDKLSSEVDKYYEEHEKDFLRIDYRTITISKDAYFNKDNIPADADAQISAIVDSFKKITTVEAFEAEAEKYFTEAAKNNGKVIADKNDPSEDDMLVQSEIMENLLNTEFYEAGYTDNAFFNWAFDPARAAGDVFTEESESGTVSVSLLVTVPYKLEYNTKNVHHILFVTSNYTDEAAAKAEADKVFAEWNNGEKTLDAFKKLAEEHNEANLSYYENLGKNATGLLEFDEWVYDQNRKDGDVALIKTYYGYHIVYFEGNGVPAWKVEVADTIAEERYEKTIESYTEAYPVTSNDKNIDKLPGTVPYFG